MGSDSIEPWSLTPLSRVRGRRRSARADEFAGARLREDQPASSRPGPKRGCEEWHEVIQRRFSVRRVDPTPGEDRDAARIGERVVVGAEQEMEPPVELILGQRRQQLTQS